MVKHTKGFKGLSKKVLSAILAASMIMTSSSFVMAAEPTEEPVVAEAQTLEANDGAVGQAVGAHQISEVTVSTENDQNVTATKADNKWVAQLRTPEVYADGEEIKPELKLKWQNTDLVEGTDYNISYTNNHTDSKAVSGEDAEIKIDFLDKYNDLPQLFVHFVINQVPISNADTTVNYSAQQDYVYNGKEQYPAITSVTTEYNGKTYELTDEDYDVIKGDGTDLINVNKGETKTFVLQGKGNFKDTVSVTDGFKIQQALIDGNVTVEANDIEFAANLTKETIEKNITVTDNFTGKALKAGEYVIEWYDAEEGTYDKGNAPSTDIGTHNFRVRGTTSGNFSNESYEEGSYEIVKDGSLQMVINKVYKDAGYKMDEFVSNGSAWVATYNGEDL